MKKKKERKKKRKIDKQKERQIDRQINRKKKRKRPMIDIKFESQAGDLTFHFGRRTVETEYYFLNR